MKFGQMSLNKLSPKADYLQLDICGLCPEDALLKYKKYGIEIPVILHGDWTKNGHSENNVADRYICYIEIIKLLQEETEVLGFTMHPPYRKKVLFEDFLKYCNDIEKATGVNLFIENRSNKNIWLSMPHEIIEFSEKKNWLSMVNEPIEFSEKMKMTIDLPQLYISCMYDSNLFYHIVRFINWKNVSEVHIGNIKRTEKNSFVARRINDGLIDFSKIIDNFKEIPYGTIEILGGVKTFEEEMNVFKNL